MRDIMREEFDRISSSLGEKLASLPDLPKEIKEVKHVLTNKLEAHMLINKYERDELEQYTRRENLRISGIEETKHEDLVGKIIQIARDIDVTVSLSDISTTHRLVKPRDKPGQIIYRFVRRSVRDDIMSNRKKLKDIPQYRSKVYINEDLTSPPSQQSQFKQWKNIL